MTGEPSPCSYVDSKVLRPQGLILLTKWQSRQQTLAEIRNEVDTFGLVEVVEIKEVLGYWQGDVLLLNSYYMPNFKLAYAEKIRQLAGPACCRAESQEDTQ